MHPPGQGLHDHSKKIQARKVNSVLDWVKIKLETIYALETGYFFSVNKDLENFLNTKKNYEITVVKCIDFRQGIMLEGNWYLFSLEQLHFCKVLRIYRNQGLVR